MPIYFPFKLCYYADYMFYILLLTYNEHFHFSFKNINFFSSSHEL